MAGLAIRICASCPPAIGCDLDLHLPTASFANRHRSCSRNGLPEQGLFSHTHYVDECPDRRAALRERGEFQPP